MKESLGTKTSENLENKDSKEKSNGSSFSEEMKKFNTKIEDLSLKIEKIQESQNKLIEDNNNFSDIKSTLDNFSKQLDDLRKEKTSLENEKNEKLEQRKNNILVISEVEDVKNKMEDAMGALSFSGGLQDRIIEISRIFLGGSFSEKEMSDLNGKELYKFALNKYYSEYIYGTDAEKVDASDYFKAVIEALRAANNPIENISKDTAIKLGGVLTGAGIVFGSTGSLTAATVAGLGILGWNSLSYNTKEKIKEQTPKILKKTWERMPGDTNLEKAEWATPPIGWMVKGFRKSIGGILGLGKKGVVGGAYGLETTGGIIGSVPGLKKVGEVTNGMGKYANEWSKK